MAVFLGTLDGVTLGALNALRAPSCLPVFAGCRGTMPRTITPSRLQWRPYPLQLAFPVGKRMPTSNAPVRAAQSSLPALPLTIEGSSVLHQMMRVRWPQWRKLAAADKQSMARELAATI